MQDIRQAYHSYDRQKVDQGVVHLGVGNFHRAHQASYLDQLLAQGDTRWGIYGVGILPGDQPLQRELTAQDGLYTLVEHNDESQRIRIVGSLLSHGLLHEERQAIIEKMADASTAVISLTVTEGGYNFNDVSGDFIFENPAIQHDLAHPRQPTTFYGLLCEALRRRRDARLALPTLLSCDNVAENGKVLRKGLLSYARELDADLASWMADEMHCPSCMVDRITPRTPADAGERWQEVLGYRDRAIVCCEPFVLWLIERNFAGHFPAVNDFEGVYFVDDVVPFERMKMLLLNASHQALAHMAALAGYDDFAEFAMLPASESFLRVMMQQEARPVVGPVPMLSVDEFIETTIKRFKNRKLGDTVARLTAITSSCYAKFVIPTLAEHFARHRRVCPLLGLAVAAWFEFLYRGHQGTLTVTDARATELTRQAGAAEKSGDYLSFFTSFPDIFPLELVKQPLWTRTLTENLALIRRWGSVGAIEQVLTAQYPQYAADNTQKLPC